MFYYPEKNKDFIIVYNEVSGASMIDMWIGWVNLRNDYYFTYNTLPTSTRSPEQMVIIKAEHMKEDIRILANARGYEFNKAMSILKKLEFDKQLDSM